MDYTRRDMLALGLGAAAMTMMPMRAGATVVDDLIAEFTGGAAMVDSGVELTTPEIAENGNTVPVAVSAPGATAVMLVAAGNPAPGVATFAFGPLAASQFASTRIRLAKTQDVIAVAKMADGSFARTTATVKVTIGGCGG